MHFPEPAIARPSPGTGPRVAAPACSRRGSIFWWSRSGVGSVRCDVAIGATDREKGWRHASPRQ
jgi:hypothetical protein